MFVSSSTSSSIIPFDSGKSYVVRELPSEESEKHRFTDRLGRTAQDRQFLDQFIRIFNAASKGKLEKCQSIVDEGYRDFSATSFGKFETSSGGNLDGISPLKIAQMNGHQHIVELFQRIAKNSKFEPKGKSEEIKQSDEVDPEVQEYDQAMKELANMKLLDPRRDEIMQRLRRLTRFKFHK